MLNAIAQLVDTIPAHWRAARTRRGPAGRSRPGIRFLDIGSAQVRLRQAGEHGPSLVFAADPPVPIEMYDGLIASLSDRYRITVLELPGFGCSLPRIGFRYSMPNAVLMMSRVLEKLPGGPHVLALPCVTGFIALGVARSRPDLVHALVLSQTPDWNGAQHWLQGRDPKRLLRRPIIGQLALAAMRRRRADDWYATVLADRSQAARYAAATREHFDQGGGFALASAFQDFLSDHDYLAAPVQQPALIVWGDADASHAQTDPYATTQMAPNSRLVRLQNTGHFPELESPTAFVNALDHFLATEQSR